MKMYIFVHLSGYLPVLLSINNYGITAQLCSSMSANVFLCLTIFLACFANAFSHLLPLLPHYTYYPNCIIISILYTNNFAIIIWNGLICSTPSHNAMCHISYGFVKTSFLFHLCIFRVIILLQQSGQILKLCVRN